MLAVCGAVDLAGLALLVVGVALPQEHRGYRLPAAVYQRYERVFPQRPGDFHSHREGDGHAPRQAAGEAHVLDYGLVVLPQHEAFEGAEDAACDHLQVGEGPTLERNPRQPEGIPYELFAILPWRPAIHQVSAVWRYGAA